MSGLARLRPAAGRSDRRAARAKPLERPNRIVELEVLDAFLLELRSGCREARVGAAVLLEQFVVRLGLADQMAAEIGFANPRTALNLGSESCGTAMSGLIPPACTDLPDGV